MHRKNLENSVPLKMFFYKKQKMRILTFCSEIYAGGCIFYEIEWAGALMKKK